MTEQALSPSETIPVIEVVSGDQARPLWSVMIPTYNCASLLRETLESVLVQDPGPQKMHIEVVDDGSTKDDPEAVVREVGRGRVLFFRQPKNVGPTRNFNTCLRRSTGKWVHVLHGDDLVLPGFYAAMEAAAGERPDTCAVISRAFIVDGVNDLLDLSPKLGSPDAQTPLASELYYSNPVRTPAVVVNRTFYEQHGGFDERFIHVADWDMWIRLLLTGKTVFLNHPWSRYRDFAGNHTASLSTTSADFRDVQRLGRKLAAQQLPDFDESRFKRMLALGAFSRYQLALAQGNQAAAESAAAIWKENTRPLQRAYASGVHLLKKVHTALIK